MFIQTEETPNPDVLKFLPGQKVVPGKTIDIRSRDEAEPSPLAQKLFDIKGVKSIFLGDDFISVTRDASKDWFVLKPQILSTILDFYMMGMPVWDESKVKEGQSQESKNAVSEDDSEIVKQIKELLETRVRPAVAQDGGDIVFHNFDDGIVFLEMRGACAGCPSSTATLKAGIENMLTYYIPEVKQVEAVQY